MASTGPTSSLKRAEGDRRMIYAIVEGEVYTLPYESEALASAMYQLGLTETLTYSGGLEGDEPERVEGVFYPGDKL